MKTSSQTQARLDGYFSFLLRWRAPIFAVALAALLISGALAAKLTLRTNLAELLPKKLPSVQTAQEASRRLGGTGLLLVGVQGPHYAANRAFVEAFAQKIEPLVGKSLRYYEYRFTDIRDYLHKYALHYLDDQQLADFNERLRVEIEKHKDKAFGDFLGIGDEEKPVESSSQEKDLSFEGLDPSFRSFLAYRDAYLSADDGKVMVLSLRPLATSLGVGDARVFRDQIHQIVAELDPKKFDPALRVEFAGNVQQTLEEFDTIRGDLFDTSIHLVLFIVAAIFLFLWSIPALVVLGLTLLVAVIYTFGCTQLGIGYLNTQTAFLASLVVGTGINYGIIFLARYKELRKTLSCELALRGALKDTIAPTLIGSSSTAVAFLTLLVSDNKGLSQFGFIGGIGVSFCWIVTYSLLPMAVFEYERRGWRLFPWNNPLAPAATRFGRFLASLSVRHWRAGLVVLAVALVVSAFGVARLAKDPIEYNFDNVRTKLVYDPEFIGFRERTYKVFPTSSTPAIIFADNEAEARELCPTVRSIKAALPEEKDVIQVCTSLYDVVPAKVPMTAQRHKLLETSRTLLQNGLLKYSEYGASLAEIGKNFSFRPPEESDIPPQIRRRFKELDGRAGLFAVVSPNHKTLNDGRNLLNFTDSLTNIKLPQSGRTVSAASDSFVFADILRGIRHDASLISLLAFVSVIIHCVIFAGGLRNGLFMGLCLVISSFWMVGIQGWMGIKYNFFNFIALPLTFGIGIDYPVNVFLPILHDAKRDFGRVFTTSGAAVTLCSLTTFIGYLALWNAKSQALSTFAHIAIMGEFACLIGALFVVPVLMQAFSRGQSLAPRESL